MVTVKAPVLERLAIRKFEETVPLDSSAVDRFLQENKVEPALFVMEKTVELFPDSWNAWDSLGEVSAKAGKKDRAIECYRKSLELNPKNKNGRAMLEQLEKAP